MDRKEWEEAIREHHRRGDESSPWRYSRRLLWFDFLLVILFMFITLYFFWPNMFRSQNAQVPRSVINDCFHSLMEIHKRCLSIKEEQDDIISYLEEKQRRSPEMMIYLLDMEGELLLGKKPSFFNPDMQNELFSNPHGSLVYKENLQTGLLLHTHLFEGKWILAVAKTFPPLLQ